MKRTLTLGNLMVVAAGLVLVVTGCSTVEDYSLTSRLWAYDRIHKYNQPSLDPKLALFEATNGFDVVVEYDALSDQHSSVRRQAYYLQESEALIAAGKKPKLITPVEASGLKPIPVVPAAVGATNVLPQPYSYAVLAREGRGFILYRSPKTEQECDLPVYAEPSGTAARVLVTPFAVAGDVVIVAVGVGIVGGMVWLYCGAPGLACH